MYAVEKNNSEMKSHVPLTTLGPLCPHPPTLPVSSPYICSNDLITKRGLFQECKTGLKFEEINHGISNRINGIKAKKTYMIIYSISTGKACDKIQLSIHNFFKLSEK